MESGERRLEHELVRGGQGPNDVEVQVGRGAREDQVRRERVDVACGCKVEGSEEVDG